MSKGVKITLVVVGVLLVLCCIGAAAVALIGGRFASQAFSTDPAKASQTGHEIADYALPAGYQEQGSMNIAGVKFVVIAQHAQSQAGDQMVFMLMQFPSSMNLSQEEMQRQMDQAIQKQFQSGNQQMEVVGTEDVTIKGQPVTLTVSEGKGSSGTVHRQVTGVFSGKGGLAMFMAIGAKDTWDQATISQFLASIR